MAASSRLNRLADVMATHQVGALLITHLADVRWICGFTGSNAAVVVLSKGRRVSARLFTDGRYAAQAAQEVRGTVPPVSVRIARKSALAEAVAYAANEAGGDAGARCGFDPSTTTVATLKSMRQMLSGEGVRVERGNAFWKPVERTVSKLREVKDHGEVEGLRRAAELGCALYEGMLAFIEVGMREQDVATELEHRARLAGAERMSFETIVASGVRSAMPHARATDEVLAAGTLLTLDFGIMLDGYCSDMTRTVFLRAAAADDERKGRAKTERKLREEEQRRVFHAVLEAQEAAVDSVRTGVAAGAVDAAARGVLRRHGLLKWFTHSTGHGVGLEIHEGPRIAAEQTQLLEAGMVITIEPGAYMPGAFGVRIEDTVVVLDDGCEMLTPVYKGWVEL